MRALDDADPSARDVAEADVEAAEVVVEHELDPLGDLLVEVLVEQAPDVEALGVRGAVGLLRVGREDAAVELLDLLDHVALADVRDVVDQLPERFVFEWLRTRQLRPLVLEEVVADLLLVEQLLLNQVLARALDHLVPEGVYLAQLAVVLVYHLLQVFELRLL